MKSPSEKDRLRVAKVLHGERIFSIHGGHLSFAVQTAHVGLPPSMVKSMQDLLSSGGSELCDLRFVVGTAPNAQTFDAHMVIVASVDSAFSRQINEAPDSKPDHENPMLVTLPDADPQVFRILLEFTYTGPSRLYHHFMSAADSAQPLAESLFALIDLADSFGMDVVVASALEVLARISERMWSLLSADQKKVNPWCDTTLMDWVAGASGVAFNVCKKE